MVIRPAVYVDYEAVSDLLIASYDVFMGDYDWYANYRLSLSETAKRAQFSTVLVAEDERQIVGTVTVYTDTDRHGVARAVDAPAQIAMLAVAETVRSQGVGRRLMEAAISEGVSANRTAATLHTMPTMSDAQRLYDRMGFSRDPDNDVLDDEGNLVVLGYRIDLRVPSGVGKGTRPAE